MTTQKHPHVVILGGGFGGLYCAKSLRRAPCDITLLDRQNYHLFQPLLYQVATGGLSPANIAAPLRSVLKRYRNVRVLLGDATDIDPAEQRLILADGSLRYDYLVVAAGMRNNYFGNTAWSEHAPGLKTLADATEMRRRVLLAFERAERCKSSEERAALLRFVVIGAGPTGVELAGALSEIARHTLHREFRRINPRDTQVLLLDGAERVLPAFPTELSASAQRQLQRLGVEVQCGARVTAISDHGVTYNVGDQQHELAAGTVLWGAGVKGAGIGEKLAQATGVELDRAGRLPVAADCSLPGHENIFVIGDLAHFPTEDGETLPGIAPVAMQQGHYVARLIAQRCRGGTLPAFRYKDRGMMATIGRAAAVADLNGRHLSGYIAWLAWLFVHLFFLIEFQNRLLVMLQWAWNYATWSRSSRLIVDYAADDESGPRPST